MFVLSKPILIAVTGVAGLAIVIGGVLVLRHRARPAEERVAPVVQEEANRRPQVTEQSSDAISEASAVPEGTASLSVIDSDGDGLTDQEERQIGTSTILRDTDGDGVTDYDEVRVARTNPLLATIHEEESHTVDSSTLILATTTSSATEDGDRDGDGLRDRDEVVNYLTNPDNPDTDADGYSDGQEVQRGYNPRGPGKCEQSTCLP